MRVVPLHLYMYALAATAPVPSACTTGPAIRRETNPAANFSSYKTFGFLSPLATDRFSYESLFTQHLKDVVVRAMESKGYVFCTSTPDLILSFYVNIEDRQHTRTTPASVTDVSYVGSCYKQGTLTIDLVDAKLTVLAWTATAEGRISDDAIENPGAAIDTLVIDMMAPLAGAVR